MMRKKILSTILALSILAGIGIPVLAEIDYSSELAEIRELLNLCNDKGIRTDYETVYYNTLERFNTYLKRDEVQGVDSAQLEYNHASMVELITETKENLNAYLEGSKTPYKITYPDMSKIVASGNYLTDGSNPVYSIGYGHFEQARQDIENFDDFGVSNIQIEIGPTSLEEELAGWFIGNSGNCDGTITLNTSIKSEGNRSIKIVNNSAKADNVYVMIRRIVPVKPLTTYTLSYDSRGQSVSGFSISINGFNDRSWPAVGTSWETKTINYTTAAEQRNAEVLIVVDDTTNALYLDNFVLKEAGNEENLLEEIGGFESDNNLASAWYVTDVLKKAEENNISVTLLLSPHYFPEDMDESLYTETAHLIKYNIDADETRNVIENYLRTLLPTLAKYDSLTNICLSNEPTYFTYGFSEYYKSKYQKYLENIHGTIKAFNKAYNLSDGIFGFGKTSYDSFEEIPMPTGLAKSTVGGYDWMNFNDEIFAKWHQWMAGIVKECIPGIPVHSKMMNPITTDEDAAEWKEYLIRGNDVELFGEFSDWAGNDNSAYIDDPDSYYAAMLYYDYLSSVTGKPVYNSEDHIIKDGNIDFNELQRRHWRNNLWQGALHGRAMSTIWLWQRSYSEENDAYNSLLHRPDIVAETGKTQLDFFRLAKEINRLQTQKPEIALWYSKPSRLYSTTYIERLLNAYKSLITSGVKVGVVSDRSVEQLSKYKVLVISGAENINEDSIQTIKDFLSNGGNVIYSSGSFAKNEYDKSIDNLWLTGNSNASTFTGSTVAEIKSSINEKLDNLNMRKVTIIDNVTGEQAEDVEWVYDISSDSGSILINVSNLSQDTSKNLSVYYGDTKLENMRDLVSGVSGITEVSLEGYSQALLSFGDEPELPEEPETPEFPEFGDAPATDTMQATYVSYISNDSENRCITWKYVGNPEMFKIYKISSDGSVSEEVTLSENSYSYGEETNVSYVVKAVNSYGRECAGRGITITNGMPFEISLTDMSGSKCSGTVKVKNTAAYRSFGIVTITLNNDKKEKKISKTVMLNPEEEKSFTFGGGISNVSMVKVEVTDCLNGNKLYSNSITY